MRLRTQIFLLLFFLGLAPLLATAISSVPLILDRIEHFYHDAYLEKLRTGFHELDQHITRRQEIVRLFAKIPEPGLQNRPDQTASKHQLVEQRAAYTDWANRVLFDQQDIIQIIFISPEGEVSFSLDRDNATGLLRADNHEPDLPSTEFFSQGLKLRPGAVQTSPIRFRSEFDPAAPNRFMSLSFISPLVRLAASGTAPELGGMVVFNLDIGGLTQVYKGIYWAQNDGDYLSPDPANPPLSTAFQDFPGLEALFSRGNLELWEKGDQQIFWLPLFQTESSGPLWVGRSVDPSPIIEFLHSLQLRIAAIVTILLFVVLVVARIIAVRTERISDELTSGVSEVLIGERPVHFSWKRPEELRALGESLTNLAKKHAEDTHALRQYAEDLEESNKYKSQFLANVSHELRTPLNSILLLSKLLTKNSASNSDDNTKRAQVIHSAGKDLRALIDSILDLSKIEAGETSVEIETVSLKPLLADLYDLMQPQFDEKGLTLALKIEDGMPTDVTTDADKLRQILINFLSNALKFTEQGGATLTLSSHLDATISALEISVIDSGIGIRKEEQSMVFEAFKQVDGTTSRRYGGTGLGLSISRELAGLIGATITVTSTVGEGSVFTLLLPLQYRRSVTSSNATQIEHDQTKNSDIGTEVPHANYKGNRILLIDDDLQTLLKLTPVLEQWGIEVAAAGDHQEIIDTLHGDAQFDLIFVDTALAKKDEFEAVRQIRKNSLWNSIPMVALVDHKHRNTRLLESTGIAHTLSKPIELLDLKVVLDQHLDSNKDQHDTL